ncbi:hypothetical protein [Bradyrhizobium diversitatis]|uniref:Uncharacterized protein n=1 Tax=Bradyrhizobium diversitatis TaxID=2755406 RepID=A0ABS0PCR7_9BRAD|nr:hypothetical protein [Bradyrhizobium diversitatis]MBH5391090.1 hypothetical protein [Bradyrhizobium diversitatis]
MRERASNSFDDAGAAGAAIAMEDMAMNDDVVPEARACESLRLIKAFLRLTDPVPRRNVIHRNWVLYYLIDATFYTLPTGAGVARNSLSD